MRILLLLALIVVAGGGYLAYMNPGTVSLTFARDRSLAVGLGPLLMAAVAVGLAMGFGATLWHDLGRLFRRLGAGRRQRHGERLRELLAEASNARAAGRVDRAEGAYRKALKLEPENLSAVTGLGHVLRQKGAAKEAISLHRLAARLAPERMALRLAMIDDYVAMESFESAAQQIDAGLKDDPKHQGLLTRLRDLRVATGDWAGAAAAQERLMNSPMDGLDSRTESARLHGFWYEAATALIAEGHPERAREALSALTREVPDFAPAYMALGSLRMREGVPKEALKVYQAGYEHTRDDGLLPPIENLLIVHLEDPQGAIDYFTHLLDRDPKSPRLHYWLGRVYYRLEMIDDAVQVLSALEESVERFPALTELMVRIHLRRQDVAEALALLGEGSPAIPYACRACHTPGEGWAAHCPACGRWGTVRPELAIVARPEPSGSAPTPLLPAPT